MIQAISRLKAQLAAANKYLKYLSELLVGHLIEYMIGNSLSDLFCQNTSTQYCPIVLSMLYNRKTYIVLVVLCNFYSTDKWSH